MPTRSDIYNCTFKNTYKVSIIYIIIESEEASEQSQQGKENPSPTEGACGTIADEKQGNCTDYSGMHDELSYQNNIEISFLSSKSYTRYEPRIKLGTCFYAFYGLLTESINLPAFSLRAGYFG